MKLLFLDTETTGLDPDKNAVIQIAGVVEINGEVKEEFNFKCKPLEDDEVELQALDVQKLTVEELELYPESKPVYEQFSKMLDSYVDRYNKADKFYMVGQNTKFDYDFLNSWFKKHGDRFLYSRINYHLIDIMQMSAMFKLAGLMEIPNLKLETIAKYFKIPLDAHKAENDVKATREVFHKYLTSVKDLKIKVEAL